MEEARNDSGLATGQTEGTKRQTESPFCYIDGHVSSQNAELKPTFQQYKRRVVIQGDMVKDDSGADAVFTEQGSSASQMTCEKVLDVYQTMMDKQLTLYQPTLR